MTRCFTGVNLTGSSRFIFDKRVLVTERRIVKKNEESGEDELVMLDDFDDDNDVFE